MERNNDDTLFMAAKADTHVNNNQVNHYRGWRYDYIRKVDIVILLESFKKRRKLDFNQKNSKSKIKSREVYDSYYYYYDSNIHHRHQIKKDKNCLQGYSKNKNQYY